LDPLPESWSYNCELGVSVGISYFRYFGVNIGIWSYFSHFGFIVELGSYFHYWELLLWSYFHHFVTVYLEVSVRILEFLWLFLVTV
jgi:hypothetical protein